MHADSFFGFLGVALGLCFLGLIMWRLLGSSVVGSWRSRAQKPLEPPLPSTPSEPVVIYSGSFIDATQLQDRLRTNGIRAFMLDQTGSSLIPLTLHFRLAISKQDLERAKQVIQAFEVEQR